MRLLLLGVLLPAIMIVSSAGLPGIFRRRLRDLLSSLGVRQVALAKHLDIDQARISKILRFDREAATVKLGRIEQIAAFLNTPALDMLRYPNDPPLAITKQEEALLEVFRRLPQAQQDSLLQFLEFTFEPLKQAKSERATNRMLRANLERRLRESNG